jgi:hypothetical protein
MTLKNIASRFPNLKVGEVIYVFANGVIFNKGTNDERRKNARAYSFRHNTSYEVVEKKAKPPKEDKAEKNNDSKN